MSLHIIGYCTQLFNSPAFLFDKFSEQELEQGFWELQSVAFDYSVGYLLADVTIPLPLRLTCIESMYNLYREFFSGHGPEEAAGMWRDGSGAALHGMGHLRHPDTERVVMAYLEAHPKLDTWIVDYALDCITGDSM